MLSDIVEVVACGFFNQVQTIKNREPMESKTTIRTHPDKLIIAAT